MSGLSNIPGPRPATLVEVVGIDGSGKTTLVRAVAHQLGGQARKVTAYSESFHVAAAGVGRAFGSAMEATLRGLAVASALIQEAAVPASGLQVFDRYVEGAKMFFAVHDLSPVPRVTLEALPQPDLVILLDVDVELAMARRLRPSCPSADEEIAYLQACSDYLRRTASDDGWLILDARCAPDVILGQAAAAITATAARRPAPELGEARR